MKIKMGRNGLSGSARVVLLLAFLLNGCSSSEPESLITVFNTPSDFSRRSADFTANITGVVSQEAEKVEYRLNDGEWSPVGMGEPRAPDHQFVIELFTHDLKKGMNRIAIRASTAKQKTETKVMEFKYNSQKIELPNVIDWEHLGVQDLQVEDGYWEIFLSSEGDWRVRPKPGYEGWDRTLIVSGAFTGGRRIETDMTYRYKTVDNMKDGFGIFPLWGGRPDNKEYRPRRGWNFSVVWYFDRYKGVGNEFSYKYADEPPTWVMSYHNFKIVPDQKYRVIAEAWPELDESGNHIFYRQRMKWWAAGTHEPDEWIGITDREGSPIPAGEYGVALFGYNSQVEFGPVKISALPSNYTMP